MRARLLVVLAACGTPTVAPPLANHAGAAHLVVRVPDIHGWLAMVPDGGAPLWQAPSVAAGTAVVVVPARGDAMAARAGARSKVAYGCEHQTIDVVGLDGAGALAPGVAWIAPAPLPAGWQPRGVPVRETAARAELAEVIAGDVTITTTRTDDTHAAIAIRRGGRALRTITVEKSYMDGADHTPIDLAAAYDTGGAPHVVAAFELAPGGPIVLALRAQGYEGINLSALLVGDDRADDLPDLATYYYQCAF
jgi:hypothetical protein